MSDTKFCDKCLHFDPSATTCRNPKQGLNRTTGGVAEHLIQVLRTDWLRCGPPGLWFEPKDRRQTNLFTVLGNLFK